MNKQGYVYFKDKFAGIITEDENGFQFTYDKIYLKSEKPRAVSFSLPLREEPYTSNVMFPFFDGLIPEGWLLAIAEKNWKIDRRDRMEMLLNFCYDCIGAVSIRRTREDK